MLFEHVDHLERFSGRLSALRHQKQLPAAFEFHFAKLGHELRMAFFEAIAEEQFCFVVSSFEKHTFELDRLTKEIILSSTIRELAKHVGD